LEPRLAVIRDLKKTIKDPAWRRKVEQDWKRKDGHPDYAYTSIKLSELKIEEAETRSKINTFLDNSRAYRKPVSNVILSKGTESVIPEEVRTAEREPSKLRHPFHISWKSRSLLLSLKLWFPIFWIIVGLLLVIEGGNPTQFYQSVPDVAKYVLYIFASIIAVWSGYRVFDKCDYNPSSDRGLFALKLLSGAVLMIGVVILVFSIFLVSGLFTGFQLSLVREIVSVYLIVLSFVIIITSAYLVFKFERRSGIIVYRR